MDNNYFMQSLQNLATSGAYNPYLNFPTPAAGQPTTTTTSMSVDNLATFMQNHPIYTSPAFNMGPPSFLHQRYQQAPFAPPPPPPLMSSTMMMPSSYVNYPSASAPTPDYNTRSFQSLMQLPPPLQPIKFQQQPSEPMTTTTTAAAMAVQLQGAKVTPKKGILPVPYPTSSARPTSTAAPKVPCATTTVTLESGEIVCFFGRDHFLSNFFSFPFETDGYAYNSVEQYYEAVKIFSLIGSQCAGQLKSVKDASAAKTVARRLLTERKVDQDRIEQWRRREGIEVVRHALTKKFALGTEMGDRLLATGTKYLAQANAHDDLWAVNLNEAAFVDWATKRGKLVLRVPLNISSTNVHTLPQVGRRGRNLLGCLIMEIRRKLIDQLKNAAAAAPMGPPMGMMMAQGIVGDEQASTSTAAAQHNMEFDGMQQQMANTQAVFQSVVPRAGSITNSFKSVLGALVFRNGQRLKFDLSEKTATKSILEATTASKTIIAYELHFEENISRPSFSRPRVSLDLDRLCVGWPGVEIVARCGIDGLATAIRCRKDHHGPFETEKTIWPNRRQRTSRRMNPNKSKSVQKTGWRICRQNLDRQARSTMDEITRGSVLILGDGNFSFTGAFCRRSADRNQSSVVRVVSSVKESKSELIDRYPECEEHVRWLEATGTKLMYEVDATQLDNLLDDDGNPMKFDHVIFNFPHVGGKTNLRKSRQLLVGVFVACKNILDTNGRFYLTLAFGQSGLEGSSEKEISKDPHLHNPPPPPPPHKMDSWQPLHLAAYGQFVMDARSPFAADKWFSYGYRCTGYKNSSRRFRVENGETLVFVRATDTASTSSLDRLNAETSSSGIIRHDRPFYVHDVSFWIDDSFQVDVFTDAVERLSKGMVKRITALPQYTCHDEGGDNDGRISLCFRFVWQSFDYALSREGARDLQTLLRDLMARELCDKFDMTIVLR